MLEFFLSSKKTSLILGKGYTGQALLEKLNEPVFWTSRNPQNDPHSIVFDLNDKSTWNNLPQANQTFWLFACDNLEITQNFFNQHQNKLGTISLVSTTSCLTHSHNQTVNEDSPFDCQRTRCVCEQWLKNQGVNLVLSSGIYGPNRSPLNWLNKGLIHDENGWVNLIHVDDLCQVLIQSTQHHSQTFIASDNQKYVWKDILDFAQKNHLIDKNLKIESTKQKQNKFVDATKTLNQLNINLKFKSLYDWLIQSNS